MRRSIRLTLCAPVAAALLLAACGDDPSPSASGQPPTLRIAGNTAGGGAAPAAAEMSSDMRMAAFNYQVSGELPLLDGPAASWYFPDEAPASDQIQALAAAFGVTGDVQELPADMGGGWTVGPTDGSAPSVTVSSSAMADWWYSPGPIDYPGMSVCSTGISTGSGELVDPADPDAATSDPATPDPATSDTVSPDTTAIEAPADIAPDEQCPEPVPPTGVPSEDDALQTARDLFARAGIDVDSFDLEASGDEWSTSVTGWLTLEGQPAPVTIGVTFGGDGQIMWANGLLHAPVRGPDYPRAGTVVGLERLRDQSGGWSGYSPLVARDDAGAAAETGVAETGVAESGTATEAAGTPVIDTAVPDTVPTAATPDTAVPDTVPPDTATPDPATPDTVDVVPCTMDPLADVADDTPVSDSAVNDAGAGDTDVTVSGPCDVPAPATITVTLTGVHESLWMVWDVDGAVWLAPGYTFTSDDGGEYQVIAVADEFIEVVDPLPAETVPVPDTVAVPATDPSSETAPPDTVTGTAPSTPTTVVEPVEVSPEQAQLLVGLSEAEAQRTAEGQGWTFRVVERDGAGMAVTDDFRIDRVDVTITDGVVTAATVG